jgi:hypothetical protein
MLKKERYSEIRQKRYENRQKSGVKLQGKEGSEMKNAEWGNKTNLSHSNDKNKEIILNIPNCPINSKIGSHSRSNTKIELNSLSQEKRD